MKIKWKFIILISVVMTIGIGTSSYYTISLIRDSVIANELEEMRTLSHERKNQITNLHNRASEDLVFALKNPLFVEYFELPETKAGNVYKDGTLQFTDKQKEIKTKLEQWVYHFQNKFDVDETCIIDKSGQEHARLVLSSIESDENLSPDEEFAPFFEPSFEKNLDEVHIQFPYVSPDTNRWVFAYTSPVVLGDTEKPAIYHFEMPISVFQDMTNVEHGRMYVIDKQGYLIADSESHYDSTNISEEFTEYFPPVSKILPDSAFDELMKNVKISSQGTVTYTDEYDGEVYHGVYAELPTFGWILLYHESEELMFSEHSTFLGNTQYSVLFIAAATFVGSIFSIFVISNTITRPLTKLQIHTKNVIDGKLDEKLKIQSTDEVGDLADAFNQMTSSLKKTIELEKDLAVANQKIKNEKLSSIGLLASRLAHDIKNPLTVIKTSFDLFKSDDLTEKQKEQCLRIDHAVSRITHQIENVLDFVRTKSLKIQENSLFEIIDSIIASIDMPSGITIEKHGDDAKVYCDSELLGVVFINLITNAIQAMNKSGTITIRLVDQDDKIMIEIEDDGDGIPDDVLPKIFDPLYTTKQTGTGLGLASCQSIIQQHKGTIHAYNNPTRFVIKLPKDIVINDEILK